MTDIGKLATEQRNAASEQIDRLPTLDMVRLINNEDKKVAGAVETVCPQIAEAIDGIYARMQRGGRLIYTGCGTSGRLGVLDAAECPPTYSTDPERVRAVIAGGYGAMFAAVIIVFLPTFLLYLFLSEKIIAGVTGGGVKG